MDKTFLKPIEETNPQIQRSASIPGEYEKKKKKNHTVENERQEMSPKQIQENMY